MYFNARGEYCNGCKNNGIYMCTNSKECIKGSSYTEINISYATNTKDLIKK